MTAAALCKEFLQATLEYVKYPGKDWDYQFRLAHALEDLPVEREHLDKLEQLSQLDNAIGGAAAGLVCRLAPDHRRTMLTQAIARSYNYCARIVSIGKSVFDVGDVCFVLDYASAEQSDATKLPENLGQLGKLLLSLPETEQIIVIERYLTRGDGVKAVVCAALAEWDSAFARSKLAQLVKQGFAAAIVPFYFNVRLTSEERTPDFQIVDDDLAAALSTFVDESEEAGWAVAAMSELIRRNSAWQDAFSAQLQRLSPAASLTLQLELASDLQSPHRSTGGAA